MKTFTLGADPEIFVGDSLTVRSIIGKIGGTKEHPMPLPIGDGFAVQEDNVAMEFNIPASSSKEAFVKNIRSAVDFLGNAVKDMYGYQLVKESAVSFPEEELQHPAAMVFGCDPDFNAWTGKRNPRPRAKDRNLRSCGGHVHIGMEGTDEEKMRVIRACDLFLGVPSVMMDTGALRKELYGKHGAFRIKPYGVEYRTLSNFWVFSEALTAWVYENTATALDAVQNEVAFEEDGPAIQAAIDNNDHVLAQELINKYGISVHA